MVGYDSQATATQAYNKVLELNKDMIVSLSGLAMVHVDADGKSHVETPQKIVGVSAVSGALWGMLIGLLFFRARRGPAAGRRDGRVVRQAGQIRRK